MHGLKAPLQLGVVVGVPVGIVFAAIIMMVGVNGSAGGSSAIMDGLSAFLIGGLVSGGVATVVAWYRQTKTGHGSTPAGWYDSPENDGTEWFWSGKAWTERTRPRQERVKRIDLNG
ncbi:DUF2510 domain-containing protein [Candidatus Nanopelagicales bacterium]|nr:DUF2510 domain-containing protein [Candidatus Nanopelagicales bacterium]